jgi:acyl carrier protein
MDIQQRLYEILGDVFDVLTEDIHLDTTFDQLGADELDFVELAWIIEEEFHTDALDASDLSKFETVGQMLMYINRKINSPGE